LTVFVYKQCQGDVLNNRPQRWSILAIIGTDKANFLYLIKNTKYASNELKFGTIVDQTIEYLCEFY